MGPRYGRSRAAELTLFNATLVAIVVMCCMAPLADTSQCQTSKDCCNRELRVCLTLYAHAKRVLQVPDEFAASPRARARTRTPLEARSRCTAMRTFYLCIGNHSRLCHGDLNYHSAHRGIERQMKLFNCSKRGDVFKPSPRGTTPPRGRHDACAYRKSSHGVRATHRLCVLFGDPHLRTFDGAVETCSAQGAWPLVDNEHLTVQVTNEPATGVKGRATAITKVTVMVKHHGECASSEFVTYQASGGELPGAFDDGSVELGGSERRDVSGVRLREKTPGRHVEIHLRYVDTTIVLRRTGLHYSVVVRMPDAVINDSVADDAEGGLQMCVRGCPHNERIDHREFLALRNTALQKQRRRHTDTDADVSSRMTSQSLDKMTRDEAALRCTDAGVVDYFFDACVFDLVNTGDLNFTLAARHAQSDTIRLLPRSASLLQNRTSLDELDRMYSNARCSGRASVTTHVVMTLCALLISELLTMTAGGATSHTDRCRGT